MKTKSIKNITLAIIIFSVSVLFNTGYVFAAAKYPDIQDYTVGHQGGIGNGMIPSNNTNGNTWVEVAGNADQINFIVQWKGSLSYDTNCTDLSWGSNYCNNEAIVAYYGDQARIRAKIQKQKPDGTWKNVDFSEMKNGYTEPKYSDEIPSSVIPASKDTTNKIKSWLLLNNGDIIGPVIEQSIYFQYGSGLSAGTYRIVVDVWHGLKPSQGDTIPDSFNDYPDTIYQKFIIQDAVVATPVNGVCGSAEKNYSSTDTGFSGSYCDVGTANPTSPSFPNAGSSTSWTCKGSDGGSDKTCSVSREAVASCDVNNVSAAPSTVYESDTTPTALNLNWNSTGTSCSLSRYPVDIYKGAMFSPTGGIFYDYTNQSGVGSKLNIKTNYSAVYRAECNPGSCTGLSGGVLSLLNKPTPVSANFNGTSQNTVKWVDNSSSENKYIVLRRNGACTSPGVFSKPTTAQYNSANGINAFINHPYGLVNGVAGSGSVITYTDTDPALNPSNTYCYRIIATKGMVDTDGLFNHIVSVSPDGDSDITTTNTPVVSCTPGAWDIEANTQCIGTTFTQFNGCSYNYNVAGTKNCAVAPPTPVHWWNRWIELAPN